MTDMLLEDENKKKVVFRLEMDKSVNMKVIAAKKQTTVNALYNEGVNYILDKYREFLKK